MGRVSVRGSGVRISGGSRGVINFGMRMGFVVLGRRALWIVWAPIGRSVWLGHSRWIVGRWGGSGCVWWRVVGNE
jgi:hypothetical protein